MLQQYLERYINWRYTYIFHTYLFTGSGFYLLVCVCVCVWLSQVAHWTFPLDFLWYLQPNLTCLNKTSTDFPNSLYLAPLPHLF